MNFFKLLIILQTFTFGLYAQQPVPSQGQSSGDEGLLYTRGKQFGIEFNTSGLGVEYRSLKHVTGTLNRVVGFSFSSRRHHKEYKSRGISGRRSESYYYGKLNSVFSLRPEYGFMKTLFDKEVPSAVKITYISLFGPSFTFAKPVFLQIRQNNSDPSLAYVVQRYDPQYHNRGNIIGKAPWSVGLDRTISYIGLYTKQGVNFDYANEDDAFKAIEAGLILEAFVKAPKLMAYQKSQSIFLDLYVEITFGSKWY